MLNLNFDKYAKRTRRFQKVIAANIAGIPCLLGILKYTGPGSYDYFGEIELEYEVLDRKGYAAQWLADKVTTDISYDLDQLILDYFK